MKPTFLHLEETDSTNNHLNRLIADNDDLPEGFTVWTEAQTAGRGQMGNTWLSEKGKNLLFSILLKPLNVKISDQFYISEAVAIAMLKTLKNAFPSDDFSVKWPNDIYFKEKKIAGVLIENQLYGGEISHTIVGVGLNVNQSSFDDCLPNPTSLLNEAGLSFDRQALLDNIVNSVLSAIHTLYEGGYDIIRKTYMDNLFRRNVLSKYSDSNGVFSAFIEEVESCGRIVFRLSNGEKRKYYFKEVEYVL